MIVNLKLNWWQLERIIKFQKTSMTALFDISYRTSSIVVTASCLTTCFISQWNMYYVQSIVIPFGSTKLFILPENEIKYKWMHYIVLWGQINIIYSQHKQKSWNIESLFNCWLTFNFFFRLRKKLIETNQKHQNTKIFICENAHLVHFACHIY